MKLKLDHIIDEVPGARSFIWSLDSAQDKQLEWQAGQYVVYKLPQDAADDRGEERFFTNSAAPFENHVRITTRFAGGKSSSFKKRLFEFKPGDTIEAERVGGKFVVEDPTQDYVFIAGGIGITPFRSILLDLDHRNQPMNVKMLYANRDQNFVFKNEFDALAAKHPGLIMHYFVDPEKIDEAAIRHAVPDLTNPIFMVSGPEPMVRAYQEMLLEMGVLAENIKRDMFPGYQWPE